MEPTGEEETRLSRKHLEKHRGGNFFLAFDDNIKFLDL
jgi:hypothetical protein